MDHNVQLFVHTSIEEGVHGFLAASTRVRSDLTWISDQDFDSKYVAEIEKAGKSFIQHLENPPLRCVLSESQA